MRDYDYLKSSGSVGLGWLNLNIVGRESEGGEYMIKTISILSEEKK